MVIRLDENYNAMTSTALLGYVGETNARPVSVEGMEIDGADRYVLSIDYGDGTAYEVDITDGNMDAYSRYTAVSADSQLSNMCKKLSGNEYILVKKSRIFRLRIGAAIGDNAVPSPDVAMDALDRIDAIGRQAHADMQTAVTAAETATTAANNAAKSATAAEKSADTAEQAANRAETAKASAETSATQADTARQGAETARQQAVKSQNDAKVSAAQASTSAQQTEADKTITAGYAKTAKTCADSTTADRQAVQTLAEQVTADKANVAENAAKVAEDRTAAETAAQKALENADSVNQLKEDLEKQPNLFKPIIGLNKLDNSLLADGKRILSNGTIGDLESACATEEYIEISQENGNYIALYTCIAETGNPHTCCYATAFYDVNKAFISQTRLSGVSVNNGDCRIEIPSAAKYIRTSFIKNTRFKYMCIFGSVDMELKNYESYHCKEPYPIPNDLDEKLNNLEILSENFSKKDYPVHHDNAEFTITKLRNSFTFNQNDFTFVKDELWLAKHNSNDFSNGTGIFRYKWDGEQFVHIGTINCDFGHWNVVDYCEANDCLIFGNGANDFETEGNYFVVVPHPLELGNTALIADVGIKYNVDIGYKVQALWGDSNLGENNIAVLLSNDLKTIVKVLLKRDSSGNFNGEFIELERKENLPAFGIQGADIWNNTLYVGGAESSGMYTINKVSLSDYSSVKNSVKYYKDDGTPYLGVVQGVYVGGDYVWVFVNTDAPRQVNVVS
ncbi:MAG: hypothetical protein ACLS5M_09975 [Ruminococcus sp.]